TEGSPPPQGGDGGRGRGKGDRMDDGSDGYRSRPSRARLSTRNTVRRETPNIAASSSALNLPFSARRAMLASRPTRSMAAAPPASSYRQRGRGHFKQDGYRSHPVSVYSVFSGRASIRGRRGGVATTLVLSIYGQPRYCRGVVAG